MTSKMLEIRDVATFIPVLAIKLGSDNDQERWLLSCAGFGRTREQQEEYVVLCQVNGGLGKCTCDPYDWGQNPRTYLVAHDFIMKNFDSLLPGAVVDVQHVLGETPESKTSERQSTSRMF